MSFAIEAASVLGVAGLLLSIYVFTAAARSYVSDDAGRSAGWRPPGVAPGSWRRPDRRSGRGVSFPLVLDGSLIENDRRVRPDRRNSPA